MKKTLSILVILTMILSLMGTSVFASVAYQGPYWKDLTKSPFDLKDIAVISDGDNIVASSGTFHFTDGPAHIIATLKNTNGDTITTLLDEYVDVTPGYELVAITQADYVDSGSYVVHFTVSDNDNTKYGLLQLNVLRHCADGKDNDGDGLTDMQDPGCSSSLDNDESDATSECQDGIDNDGDGFIDFPDDLSCNNEQDYTEDNWDPGNTQCSDGLDNDGDTLVDLDDPGCDNLQDDSEFPVNQIDLPECSDGEDNDGDGFVDLDDPGCEDADDDSELPFNQVDEPQCNDGLDNDNDGFIDLDDPNCNDENDNDESPWDPGNSQCSDGLDNDGDGFTDLDDPGCENPEDDDELPFDVVEDPQCSDGLDNDGDGYVDGDDPGCETPDDDDEFHFNQPPTLAPTGTVQVEETQTVSIQLLGFDANGDALTYGIDYLGANPFGLLDPVTGLFTWQTGYTDAGMYPIQFSVTDFIGESMSQPATIIVVNKNQAPIIQAFDPMDDPVIFEGDSQAFSVFVVDPDFEDNGNLQFVWTLDGEVVSNGMMYTYSASDDSTGIYDVTVTVSDGIDFVSHSWVLTVLESNDGPTAVFTFEPLAPAVYEDVQFTSLSSDPDGDVLDYAWDFDGDGVTDSTEPSPVYAFESPGVFDTTLTVSDGELQDSYTEEISVSGDLSVTDLTCFNDVIENKQQACIVSVGANGDLEGGVEVNLYSIFGEDVLGSCTTNQITGKCTVLFAVGGPGEDTVYATANKDGFESDLDMNPQFTFNILEEKYKIDGLTLYKDLDFSIEGDEFYRSEYLYVKFRVLDEDDNPTTDVVTDVELVSGPGGVLPLSELEFVDGYYYYMEQIPPVHEFLGTSQVFTFAFNFDDNSGAEEVVELTILNNLPVIDVDIFDEFAGVWDQEMSISLTHYESDVEDSGNNLVWSLEESSDFFDAVVGSDDVLTITPLGEGTDNLILTLTDLDGDSDTVTVTVNTLVVLVHQCSDGIDNDGDGLVDFPADLGCESEADDDETDILPVNEDPVALLVLVPVENQPLTMTFDGSQSYDLDGEIVGYSWVVFTDGGDLVNQDLAIDGTPVPFDFTFPQSGDYVINFLVEDNLGAQGSVEVQLTVEDIIVEPVACADGLDNDGDGLVDMDDIGCESEFDDDEFNEPVEPIPQCSDGLDNDGDGLVDMDDSGCENADDDDEFNEPVGPQPQCNDGIDNDGNGLVDLEDPKCSDASDDLEGFEPKWHKDYSTPFVDLDDVFVTKISYNSMFGGDHITPGDFVSMTVSFENNMGTDLEDVKVVASIYDLDVFASDKLNDLDSGDTESSHLSFEVPKWAAPGVYDLRLVISNDDFRRVKYRPIELI